MVVGFGEELDAAGLGECVEQVQDFRREGFELFEGRAGDGECETEPALVLLDEGEEKSQCREVAIFGDAIDDDLVVADVEVIVCGVEDGVLPQAEGLVDLEVEADRGHKMGMIRCESVKGEGEGRGLRYGV